VARRPFTRVAVLVFEGAPLFETSVPLSVFGVDRTSTGAPVFECWAVAGDEPPLVTTTGLSVSPGRDLSSLEEAEVVIVPTWRDPDATPSAAVLAALRRAHEREAIVVGLCLGAFVLAAAGLLDGRRAATHWLHSARLAERFPAVHVDPTVLFVDEGDVLTSAGTAAGIDACLHLVRTAYGARTASAIARRMVVAPQRTGGQAQFIELPVPESNGDDNLVDVLDHAVRNLATQLTVDDLADRAHLSRRHFDRRFREVTGTSPLRWLLHQRVLAAQRLLEDTDLPVDEVAAAVGMGQGVTLRPHFRRQVGVSPQTYRTAFGARAGVSAPGGG
jgi:transcriptional regulator GlxA family with amidase domain